MATAETSNLLEEEEESEDSTTQQQGSGTSVVYKHKKIFLPRVKRKNISDIPFSVEDTSSSVNVKVPTRNSVHYINRPKRGKSYHVCRVACAVVLLAIVALMITVAVVLILTSQGVVEVWWRKTIIYQVYPQSFQDSDGDGYGDLRGIKNRVSYFDDLGVKTIWINPIFESPQKDNGYDISNYTAIFLRYGTMDQFKELLNELHRHDIHLLLDFVPNHTSNQHPWFKDSCLNKTKKDWYVWANGVNGGPPNNWISVFGNSSWTYNDTRGQWYLHQFSSFQPDLNYHNPEVRSAMKDVLSFWLDMGVDGFRVDAAKYLLEDPELKNETANPSFHSTQCCVNHIGSQDCYNMLIHDKTTNYVGIHDIIRDWHKLISSYSGSERILIGEVYDPIDTVVSYYGNNDEFTFPFNFFLLENKIWNGSHVDCIVGEWLDKMPTGGAANWVLGNHDNPRIASRAGLFRAKALNVLLLTLPGTPTTYYGEEILMTDVDIPPEQRVDQFGGRDPQRTPMQWDATPNAGFCTYTNCTSPWLPVAANYTTYNVKNETASSTSMLALYKQLSELRSSEQSFTEGRYGCLLADEDVLAYIRYPRDEERYKAYIIAINFSNKVVTTSIDLDVEGTQIKLSSYLDHYNDDVDLSSFKLREGEAVVMETFVSSIVAKDVESKGNSCYCDTNL